MYKSSQKLNSVIFLYISWETEPSEISFIFMKYRTER